MTLFDEFFRLACGVVGSIDGESVAVLKLETSESLERDRRERNERLDLVDPCVSERVNDGYDFNESFCFDDEFPMFVVVVLSMKGGGGGG
jgi:hypothetical protein